MTSVQFSSYDRITRLTCSDLEGSTARRRDREEVPGRMMDSDSQGRPI